MGWRQQGIGRGLGAAARLVAAPLALLLAVALLPSRTRTAASSAGALRERMGAVVGTPDGTRVEASLAAALSNPALARSLRDRLARDDLDPTARDLLRAALIVSASSSALAGRLLDTPSTAVDRRRLADLARDLRANPAVARMQAAGAALGRQPWPLQLAVDRARAALLTTVADTSSTGSSTDSRARRLTSLSDLARSAEYRSTARSVARVLADPGAAGFVRTLTPVVVASLLDADALVTGGAATADPGLRLAASVVVIASAVLDGSRSTVATGLTTATAIAASPSA